VRPSPAQSTPASQQGFILIEVLVSALVLVIASAGVVALLQTTVHAQGEQRLDSEAYALAQEDQARLASTQLALLNHLSTKHDVPLNGTTFHVYSTGTFVNDRTSAPSCGEQTSTADYVQINSRVTWDGMGPGEGQEIESIISPSNGSLDPNHGTLAVLARGDALEPAAGLVLSATGGAFEETTNAEGCAVFPDLVYGNYTLNASGAAAGLVNQKGETTESQPVTVEKGATKRIELRWARAATIQLNFKFRVGSTETFTPSSANSVVVYNSSSGTAAKPLYSAGGGRETPFTVTPLFPFTSPYAIYAGSCSSDNPNPEGLTNPPTAVAIANVTATAGQTTTGTIQLPAFEPTVWTGTSSTNKGTGFPNTDVWVRDANCTRGSEPLTYRFTTNSSGKLLDPSGSAADVGLPWGTYNVCVDTNRGTSGASRRLRISSLPIKSLTSATPRDIYLGEGAEGVVNERACP
jgi:type II secretory pathway pseudopilin PulG